MSKFLAQRYMTLPRSTLPDVAVVTVDFASEHHLFLLGYVHSILCITCDNFILIFATINWF